MAYSGEPIFAADLLFRPEHSLIDQSLHSRLGETTTNGDGFGVGWYGESTEPTVYKSIEPVWHDENLREISRQVRTPMLLAHVRASTGTAVQRSNCHPFRHGQWLWMHNGVLRGFHEMRRELLMAVEPALFSDLEGSTDSEALFYLAMTFGLADDPLGAVARAVGYVEEVGRVYAVENPVQMTVATTNGNSLWIFRYSSERHSRSLFFSTEISKLRALHPEVEVLHELGGDTRFVVSEPLRDLEGAWNEVPESSAGVVRPGGAEIRPFQPVSPT
jgi:predicted glutamine amidotransferase